MDTASPQPGHLVLPLAAEEIVDDLSRSPIGSVAIPRDLADDLWLAAEAEACGLAVEEFRAALSAIGEKFNFGLPPGASSSPTERLSFLRSLRLTDLALATACALGREMAWQHFLRLYRATLTQAGSPSPAQPRWVTTLPILYAELYGLRTTGGTADSVEVARRSPLSSYSGRGSLLGWLRTTLAQRHVDHHRRTRRETSLDTLDAVAPEQKAAPVAAELTHLAEAVRRTLRRLGAEDRFLLSAYFLDRQTLLQIARTLQVHEATISRRIKRLTTICASISSRSFNPRASASAPPKRRLAPIPAISK